MDFGLLMLIRNPAEWHRSDHEVYQAHIKRAVMGEKLGFTHVWTSEHHFSPGAWSPSQFPILAAIAQQTEKIRVGTYVLLVPFHNPICAAEDAATVDIISNGRLELGVGPGSHPLEFATFGVPFKERRARMYEGLEIIKNCFYEREFSFEGKYWQFSRVQMTTKPVQKKVPIWIAAIGPKALEEAGAQGYNLAAGGPADLQKIYDMALEKAGHDPQKVQRANLHIGHLAETDEKAWDEAEPHMRYYIEWQAGMVKAQRALNPNAPVHSDMELAVPPLGELRKTGRGPYAQAFVGSPETVIDQLEDELRVYPLTQIIWSMGLPGQDPRQADRSAELFAKEVMPHFKHK
jgi:alkanesulfonate monooxygenase SsuD/methylene tetrahydromethanopterin reductase-like flavin-dependent oxidoreductase (luciferase family)